MHTHRSQGFTLIELLVVIAIIGVLSAVVLASLNTARSKGNDAAIQSNMATIQTQAEIYYGSDGLNSYGGVPQPWVNLGTSCLTPGSMFSDPIISRAMKATDESNGANTVNAGLIGCASTATTYVIAAQLTAEPTKYWCVDSTGNAKKVTGTLSATALTGGVCPP